MEYLKVIKDWYCIGTFRMGTTCKPFYIQVIGAISLHVIFAGKLLPSK